MRKTNGWRGLSAAVSVLYLFYQRRLIYDTHKGECPSPLLREAGTSEDNGKFKMRKIKNEGWKKRTTRETKETEKLSAEKVRLEDSDRA